MTKKLFYEDGYLADFTATVIKCKPCEKGYEVVLDQTAFYPEGGGQPADTGILGSSKVSYVYEKEDTIFHVTDQALEVGSKVEGKIDFDRRFDLMQQHSGEHILSGLVNKQYGYNNVGFHLASDYVTCDFDGELTKEQVLEIEQRANEAIYKDLEISCIIYDDSEIKDWAYRSKLDLKGKIRLVTVPDFDVCACCGIHVKTTGEIGIVKVTNVERHRGGVRITMLCGKRALEDYGKKQEVISKVGQMLSAKPEVITTHLEKIQDELGQAKLKMASLTAQLFEYKSEDYLKTNEPAIFVCEEDLAGELLRKLCILLTEKTEKMVLVLTGDGENFRYALGAKELDVREMNNVLTGAFEGKGGGKSGLCQGNLVGNSEAIRQLFYTKIAH